MYQSMRRLLIKIQRKPAAFLITAIIGLILFIFAGLLFLQLTGSNDNQSNTLPISITSQSTCSKVKIKNDQLAQKISLGDKILIGETLLISKTDSQEVKNFKKEALDKKQAGTEAFAKGDCQRSIKQFEEARELYINDPETLIYLNNVQAGKNPLTIAAVVPIETNINIAQEILRGVAAAQDEMNQVSGNIQKVKVEIVDAENDEEVAKIVAEELVEDDKILAVIGHNASNASLAAAPIYQEGQLVMVSPTSTASSLSGIGTFIFRTSFSNKVAAGKLADYAVSTMNKSKIAFCIDSTAKDNITFRQEFINALTGEEIDIECDVSASGFNEEIAEEKINLAVKKGANGLFVASHVDRLDKLYEVAQANQRKHKLALFTNETPYTQKTLEIGGQAVEELMLVVPWHRDINRDFSDKMQKLWGGGVNWRTATAYDATKAVITGLRQDSSRQGLQQILQGSNFSFQGATGNIRFDDQTGDRIGTPLIVQIFNNEFIKVSSTP